MKGSKYARDNAPVFKRDETLNRNLEILYFAYGSNMDDTQMADRCQNYKYIATGKLPDHKFIINSRGVATIVPEINENVYGVVWALSGDDIRCLDRYEGVSQGIYIKVNLPVIVPHFSPIEMLVYVAADNQFGKPKPGYLENIIAAAIKYGLPSNYLQKLRGCLTSNP